jgi:hypothetical protein
MQVKAMSYNEIPWTSLQSLLNEEVQALRTLLSLLAEQEQALLTNQHSSDASVFREAKQNLASIQRKRYQSTGCTELSMQDSLFKKWLIETELECDILPVWEQIASLTEKVAEQESKNSSITYRTELSPLKSKVKTTSKVDTIDHK